MKLHVNCMLRLGFMIALPTIQIPGNETELGKLTRGFTVDKNELKGSKLQATEIKFQMKIYFNTTHLKMSIVFKKTQF